MFFSRLNFCFLLSFRPQPTLTPFPDFWFPAVFQATTYPNHFPDCMLVAHWLFKATSNDCVLVSYNVLSFRPWLTLNFFLIVFWFPTVFQATSNDWYWFSTLFQATANPNPMVKAELNLLAHLMGAVDNKKGKSDFRVNMFNTDEEEEWVTIGRSLQLCCLLVKNWTWKFCFFLINWKLCVYQIVFVNLASMMAAVFYKEKRLILDQGLNTICMHLPGWPNINCLNIIFVCFLNFLDNLVPRDLHRTCTTSRW